jgi:RNA polymerase sigma-70 factor, ECF subfamily
VSESLEAFLRIERSRVLASMIRFTGDFSLAEDAVHDAVVVALEQWPRVGIPRNPGAWLTVTARNKALDRIRREAKRSKMEQFAQSLSEVDLPLSTGAIRDDQLRLLFTCCHPALSAEARVALALRTLCGLTTAEIARVHLVAEPRIGQRISRAKAKIALAQIPYALPADHELPDRLSSVLTTVYSVFTIGHHAAFGSLDSRVDLAIEGIRLVRILVDLMPDEPECIGLLALMLATNARRSARVDANGDVVLMEDQDRARWNHADIAEAAALVEQVLSRRQIGPYQIQAAIACLHGLASTWDETDWAQIAVLYALLEDVAPSPVVRVNRAVAVAYDKGPEAGLQLLDVENVGLFAVQNWHLFWSTRAELLQRADRLSEASAAFQRALECETNDSDRRFLEARLAAVADRRNFGPLAT